MTTQQFSVKNKKAIITGASSGIGEAIAKRFTNDEADVVVSSSEKTNIDRVVKEIQNNKKYTGNAKPIECDVTKREDIKKLAKETIDEFEDIDILVNNAGIYNMNQFEEIDEKDWKKTFDVNLHGIYRCTQIIGEKMKQNNGGNIINISSMVGKYGVPEMTHYAASKAGIINLTKSLGNEWAKHNIRVNCIAPGFTATPPIENWGIGSSDQVDRTKVQRRLGKSEEIADITQFLASPASSYIVGETITARGTPRNELEELK